MSSRGTCGTWSEGGGPLDPRALEPQDYVEGVKERDFGPRDGPLEAQTARLMGVLFGVAAPAPEGGGWSWSPLAASAHGMPRAGAGARSEGAVARLTGIGFGMGRGLPRRGRREISWVWGPSSWGCGRGRPLAFWGFAGEARVLWE